MTTNITLFVCGDVMLGRGIDQILPHPGEPHLYERYVTSAEDYVALAEQVNGAIPRPVDYSYVWGDALAELRPAKPQVRIINLETSVTRSRDFLPKGINYRMNPENIACVTAAGVDCCVLANNHVLDFGDAGLLETLETLKKADIKSAGAGRNAAEAQGAAVIPTARGRRVLVYAFGSNTSGIPPSWAAAGAKPGVNLLRDLSDRTVVAIATQIRAVRQPGDLLVASIHWGANWGYGIARGQTRFAHALIDAAGFDVVHGHSSHHAKAIEIYRDKPILYGCGDFVNDYEGISGYEEFHSELAVMYLLQFDTISGRLVDLRLTTFKISRFRLHRASREEVTWLCDTLDRESARFGTRLSLNDDNSLSVRWW
jgi:poly-gamma-glutamate capsule biosynthesis protein CapA/YwtB (metallophosphatase superfamily)